MCIRDRKTESLPNLESLVCINNQLTALQAADGVTLQKLSAARNKCTVAMDSLNRIRFADLAENFQPSRVVQEMCIRDRNTTYFTIITDFSFFVNNAEQFSENCTFPMIFHPQSVD